MHEYGYEYGYKYVYMNLYWMYEYLHYDAYNNIILPYKTSR